MALPLEMYYATRRLAVYLEIDFKYSPYTKDRHTVVDIPEAMLAGCLIVAVKLFYNLGGDQPIPADGNSPAAAKVDWNAWAKEMEDAEPLEYHEALKMTDREVINLSNARIDDYFNFFQEHFAVEDPEDKDKDAPMG